MKTTNACPTVRDLAPLIGKPGTLHERGLEIPITIVDVRIRGGRIDLSVSIDGDSAIWVTRQRVTLEDE